MTLYTVVWMHERLEGLYFCWNLGEEYIVSAQLR